MKSKCDWNERIQLELIIVNSIFVIMFLIDLWKFELVLLSLMSSNNYIYYRNFSIYPNGDKTKGGQDHISMYLEMMDTTSLPAGWEVNAIFNFFVFDQIRDKYVGFQGRFFLIFNLNIWQEKKKKKRFLNHYFSYK